MHTISMATGNGNHEAQQTEENFEQFYETWKKQQNQHLQELITASEQVSSPTPPTEGITACSSSSPPPPTDGITATNLNNLVKRVVEHYEEYYKTKSEWADKNILQILSPPWTSSLEDAFLWIGGWRPTMAIHLLYSKSSLQFESKFNDWMQGKLTKHDLGDLTESQISLIDELQKNTIIEEKEITGKMAKQQEKAAGADMVELSHLVSEALREEEKGTKARDHEAEQSQAESSLSPKEKGFKKILEKADNLRLRTLKSIIDALSATQAVHFLIAAAELHLRLHEWGKARDEGQLSGGAGHPIFRQEA
ncbi:protein DOG1-like 4 [Coffea arabica]|uniref:Protein DOG1-like 4 n=1 Tax=Coffea arabica TaxID=13443 RepID=A0A6P6URP6_COFAR|nr:protein DOG1-like 4 [Coffea arabica]